MKYLKLLSGPVAFLFTLFISLNAPDPLFWKIIGVAVWMVIWWSTEVVALPVTALVPFVLFPALQVFSVRVAAEAYANPVIFLFLGGFIIALAMEKHKLHLRIALNLLKLTGSRPDGIVLGFMLSTAFLSMWISNTATAVMMLPIASSVVAMIGEHVLPGEGIRRFSLTLMLGIAYAANIGGTATLIGTPPNVVLAGLYRERYMAEIGFNNWLIVGIPFAILLLLLCYWTMTRLLYPNKMPSIPEVSRDLAVQEKALDSFSGGERAVCFIFVLVALLWITRGFINELAGFALLDDATIAMAGGLLMFVWPDSGNKSVFLLNWKDMERLPWGILLLFGGGLCLAKALEQGKIIDLISDVSSAFIHLHPVVLVVLLAGIMLFLTELMSNVALTTIFIPVVFGIGDGLGLHPLILAIPVTIASSCAFMMPVSTPPNAIVFASGHIKVSEMMRSGIWLNLISILLLAMLSFWVVPLMVD